MSIANASPLRSPFPPPTTDVEADRYKQIRQAVETALNDLLSSALEAGWSAQEIAVAIEEAGKNLKDVYVVTTDRTVDFPTPMGRS